MVSHLHEEGLTVVMVSHNMDDLANLCDRVAVMSEGKLLMEGTPAEVFSRADELTAVGLATTSPEHFANLLREGGLAVPHEELATEDSIVSLSARSLMMRGFSFGSYVPGTSPVHKLDARAKLLLGCAFIVITLNARSFLALIPVALFVVRAYALARIPARKALRSLAPLMFIVVIASIMNLFVVQGGSVYFEWAFIRISEQGVLTCLLIACRLFAHDGGDEPRHAHHDDARFDGGL